MNRLWKNMALAAASALLVMLVMGCAFESEAATHEPETKTDEAAPASLGVVTAASAATGAPLSQSAALFDRVAAGEAGIWVTGTGQVSMEPDLVILNLGVESMAETVSYANGMAADAMDAIMNTLTENGVEDLDIQTHNFNVRPQYEWIEIEEDGRRSNRRELVGYEVTNNLTAKIRDLESVGTLIDDVIEAGGDATRFDGINFTVEDTSEVMSQLRENAIMDAMEKAQQIADVAGVTLGSLEYITDSAVRTQRVDPYAPRAAFALAADESAATSISGGELEVSLTVHTAFSIQ
ncbi:MAG: SIMPL domain-containing protein [Dehalococcoidia bacterium]|nr:SIMPL domain-containing protein [Dehalococcoidia bacterium]